MPKPINYVEAMRELIVRELPGLPDRLVDGYTLLALDRGASTTMQSVHDAWSVWMNRDRPDHPSLIPYGQLTREKQELDRKYMEGIHRAVEEYNAAALRDR